MDKNKIWTIGSVLLMAIVLGLGWFLGIAPQLSAASAADTQRQSTQAINAEHEATLATLKKDYANLGALNSQLSDLSASVPSDTDIPAFVDEVDGTAAATGVTVAGLAVADAKPYAPVGAPSAPASGGSTGSTATPAPGATSTPTPAPAAVPGMPPVTSSKLTPANFSSLTVTLTVNGAYPQILSFVNGVQTGTRLFLVNGITTTTRGTQESAVITGLIFVVTPPGQATPAPTPSQ